MFIFSNSYCQAQKQPQAQLDAEVAIFPKKIQQPTQPSRQVYIWHKTVRLRKQKLLVLDPKTVFDQTPTLKIP